MSELMDASPKSSVSSTKREDVGGGEIRCFYEIRVTRPLSTSSTQRDAKVALAWCRAEAMREMLGLVSKSGGGES